MIIRVWNRDPTRKVSNGHLLGQLGVIIYID